MTSTQVVETSVTNYSSFQNYSHSDDRTICTTTGLLTSHSSLQAVLFGSHQDEEPFCLESAGRLAWEDQQVVALPRETYSVVKNVHYIAMYSNPEKYPYPPHRRDWNFLGLGWGILQTKQFKEMCHT